jgi:hypothetical protein
MTGVDARVDLGALGQPTIVVAAVDADWIRNWWTALSRLFVGTVLGTSGRWADLHVRRAIPGRRIVDVLQPGHPGYDQFVHLPAS